MLVLMLVFHRQFRRLLSVCGLCCGRVIILRSGEIALMVIFVPTARHWRPMVHLIQRARIVRLHVTSRGVTTRRRLIKHLRVVHVVCYHTLMVVGPIPGPLQSVPFFELHVVLQAVKQGEEPMDLGIGCFISIAAILPGRQA